MRDVQKVKEEFVEICTQFDFREVWINFDNPFSEEHNEDGKDVYVVPTSNNVRRTLSGCDKLWVLFAPKIDSDNDDEVASVGLDVYWTEEEKDKSWGAVTPDEVRSNSTLRLLYTKEGGIQFG